MRIRQDRVREIYRQALARPDETATISEICFELAPSGELRCVAINVEPEQVATFVHALDEMRERLLDHEENHRPPAPISIPVAHVKPTVMSRSFTARCGVFVSIACLALVTYWEMALVRH